ncbi:p53 isoform X1 [Rhynchophorus ferrugineus]|uniref:p53 isoform X1 n=2 Tax=Rhynchophorus ferrugineus TaxID=354439 RepID=UPI003FCEA50C
MMFHQRFKTMSFPDNLTFQELEPSSFSQENGFSDLLNYVEGEDENLPFSEDTTLLVEDLMNQNTKKHEYKFDPEDLEHLSALPDTPLANTDFPGDFNFSMNIKYKEYSENCNKIFTKMNEKFPVEFTVDYYTKEPMYIRATLQYAEEHKTTDTVVRCIMHEQKAERTNTDVSEHVWFHVLRSSNKKAIYLGNKLNKEHLSVVLPLSEPQAGVKGVKEFFYFVCMSSCGSPGISRRNLEMIFQLENQQGTVLGRRCIKARICACPRRDREKEEGEEHLPPSRGKKRKIKALPPAPGKILLPDSDLKHYRVELDVIGIDNLKSVLDHLESLTGYMLLKHKGQPGEKILEDNLHQIITMKKRYQDKK